MCQCTAEQVQRYKTRISGPLLDRIDMHVVVPSINFTHLRNNHHREESSADVARRVCKARNLQLQRNNKANAQLTNQELHETCPLDKSCQDLLEQASQRLGLSARAYHRILRLARTIADIEGTEKITSRVLSEAISYRQLDRQVTDLSRQAVTSFNKTVTTL
jgi:magnesium chelatase family protein